MVRVVTTINNNSTRAVESDRITNIVLDLDGRIWQGTPAQLKSDLFKEVGDGRPGPNVESGSTARSRRAG